MLLSLSMHNHNTENLQYTAHGYDTKSYISFIPAKLTWYCQFLLSGLFVSTIPPTLSILQWRRPAAMKRESSLQSWQKLAIRQNTFHAPNPHFRSIYHGVEWVNLTYRMSRLFTLVRGFTVLCAIPNTFCMNKMPISKIQTYLSMKSSVTPNESAI